jgi:hypothetical protein
MSLTKQDYKGAIHAQSAGNFRALVNVLADTLDRIEERDSGRLNEHPIVKLYVAQLCNLAYRDSVDFDQYAEAYKLCEERSRA